MLDLCIYMDDDNDGDAEWHVRALVHCSGCRRIDLDCPSCGAALSITLAPDITPGPSSDVGIFECLSCSARISIQAVGWLQLDPATRIAAQQLEANLARAPRPRRPWPPAAQRRVVASWRGSAMGRFEQRTLAEWGQHPLGQLLAPLEPAAIAAAYRRVYGLQPIRRGGRGSCAYNAVELVLALDNSGRLIDRAAAHAAGTLPGIDQVLALPHTLASSDAAPTASEGQP